MKKSPYDKNKLVDLYQKVAYELHGIIYLPHYVIEHRYVSPGFGVTNDNLYTEKELKDAGAERQVLMLWSRSW